MIYFAGFFLCAGIIFFAGRKLSIYGEAISDLTGLGKAWVGMILMSTVTSLPELVAGFSSTTLLGSADLAVGNMLGSCAFNLGILAIMDAFVPKQKSIFSIGSPSHILAASLGIILMGIVGLGLFLADDIAITSGIGITSISFIVIYLFSIRLIYLYNKKPGNLDRKNALESSKAPKITLKKAILFYLIYAVVTIGAALFLPYFGEHIAEQTGMGKTFVGTLFLAASTSLPEIAVSFAAIRRGHVDLALGNLLGSNLFNIFILALNDLFYVNGHLLKDASEFHLVSVLAVIAMSAVAIIGLTFRTENKRFLLAWDAVLIFGIYLLNMILLFRMSG